MINQDYVCKYRFGFVSCNGTEYKIEIGTKDYTGSVIERNLGSAPVLSRETSGHIYGSSLYFNAECQIDGEFAEFYTMIPGGYYTELTVGTNLIWCGFVSPELYSEPDIAPPYDVQITATDNLGELKNYKVSFYPPNSNNLSFYDVINDICLFQCAVDLPICILFDIQASIDNSTFITNRELLKSMYLDYTLQYDDDITYYDLLDKILTTLNARIFEGTYNGGAYWFLIHENAVKNPYPYFMIQTTTDLTPDTEIEPLIVSQASQNKSYPIGYTSSTIYRAIKTTTLKATRNYKSLLKNPYLLSLDNWTIASATYENDYVRILSGGSIKQSVTIDGSYPSDLTLTIKARNHNNGYITLLQYCVEILDQSGTKWYLDDSTKTSSNGAITRTSAFGGRKTQSNKNVITGLNYLSVETWNDIDLPEVTTWDSTAYIKELSVNVPLPSTLYADRIKTGNTNPVKITVTIRVPSSQTYTAHVYECSLIQTNQVGETDVLVDVNNNARGDQSKDSLIVYSAESGINPALCEYGIPTDSTGKAFYKFKSDDLTDATDFLSFIAKDYALTSALPRIKKTGTINIPKNNYQDPILTLYDGSISYLIDTFTWDLVKDELEFEAYSVVSATLSVSSLTIKDK